MSLPRLKKMETFNRDAKLDQRVTKNQRQNIKRHRKLKAS